MSDVMYQEMVCEKYKDRKYFLIIMHWSSTSITIIKRWFESDVYQELESIIYKSILYPDILFIFYKVDWPLCQNPRSWRAVSIDDTDIFCSSARGFLEYKVSCIICSGCNVLIKYNCYNLTRRGKGKGKR